MLPTKATPGPPFCGPGVSYIIYLFLCCLMLLLRQGLLQRQQEPSRLFAPKPLQLPPAPLVGEQPRGGSHAEQHHGDDQHGEYIHHFLVLPVSFAIPKGYPIAGRKAIKPRERLYEDFGKKSSQNRQSWGAGMAGKPVIAGISAERGPWRPPRKSPG